MASARAGVLSLTFLIYSDEDSPDDYVAHCLELDIVATGTNPPRAIRLLKELIEDVLLAAIKDDTLAKQFHPAPIKYWKRLADAERYSPPLSIKKRRINAAPVHRVDYALA